MTTGWKTRDGRADMTNFEMDLIDTRITSHLDKDGDEDADCCKHSIIKPACLPLSIIVFLLLMTFFIPLFNDDSAENIKKYEKTGVCYDDCSLKIIESIPDGVDFPNFKKHGSTFNAWNELLDEAKSTLDIAALYWDLKDPNPFYKTSWQGNETFYNIVKTSKRGVKIRIAKNPSNRFSNSSDIEYLVNNELAEVRDVNFTHFFDSGILHTKLWIVDQKHVYIGSANMDWKSLTEVKELGVVIRNCSCIAADIGKIFTIYWRLGKENAKIPLRWPINLRTNFNFKNPLEIMFNGISSFTFTSSSPAKLSPKGREFDLNAIVNLMKNATKHIHISVMDYLPTTIYMPDNKNEYWPAIDDAIRSAAFRGIHVKMLISYWKHSKHDMFSYLKSLLEINNALHGGKIEIKFFIVPATPEQKKIPFSRVNHNKYMVTDTAAYIGTSNWIGDYFLTTGGVGFVVQSNVQNQFIDDVNNIFLRDWNSTYAYPFSHAFLIHHKLLN